MGYVSAAQRKAVWASKKDWFQRGVDYLESSQQTSDTVFGKKQEDFVSLRARRKKMKNIKPIGDVGSNQFKDKNTGEIKKECPK